LKVEISNEDNSIKEIKFAIVFMIFWSQFKLKAQPNEPVSLTWQYNDTEANFKGR
jgi:hypothetical protein